MDASVIVPTYKEAGNIAQLTKRLYESLERHGLAKTTERTHLQIFYASNIRRR